MNLLARELKRLLPGILPERFQDVRQGIFWENILDRVLQIAETARRLHCVRLVIYHATRNFKPRAPLPGLTGHNRGSCFDREFTGHNRV